MKLIKKRSVKFLHGRIEDIGVKHLGPLSLRGIRAAEQFNVSILHEFQPRYSKAPDVLHSRTKELIYVIRGRMSGFLDDRKVTLEEGDYLYIPAGTNHRFETGNKSVEALSIFSPPIDMSNPDARIVFQRKGKKRISEVGSGVNHMGRRHKTGKKGRPAG